MSKFKEALICLLLLFLIPFIIMLNYAVYKGIEETYFSKKSEKPIELNLNLQEKKWN